MRLSRGWAREEWEKSGRQPTRGWDVTKFQLPDDFNGAVPVAKPAAGYRIDNRLTFPADSNFVMPFKVNRTLWLTGTVLGAAVSF